jgi:hypothetical protein
MEEMKRGKWRRGRWRAKETRKKGEQFLQDEKKGFGERKEKADLSQG